MMLSMEAPNNFSSWNSVASGLGRYRPSTHARVKKGAAFLARFWLISIGTTPPLVVMVVIVKCLS